MIPPEPPTGLSLWQTLEHVELLPVGSATQTCEIKSMGDVPRSGEEGRDSSRIEFELVAV